MTKCELNWIDKDSCLDCLHEPLKYEFIPCPEESVNFDTTENLFFECDNLDALKYLQQTHSQKVKCIYIDPPYNTGKTRQYKDDFGDITGCKHSDWLNMMKPRLVLGRELLSDDGVIFISIDDNEQAQLKMLCDEVFGEENFIACFYWMRTATPPALSRRVRKKQEPILCYGKLDNIDFLSGGLIEGGDMPLMNEGNNIRVLKFARDSLLFKIPDGIYRQGVYDKIQLLNDIEIINGHSRTDVFLSGCFKWTQETLDNEIKKATKLVVKTMKFSVRYERLGARIKVPSNIISKNECEVGTNEDANKEILNLFNRKCFCFPKPISLIKYLVNTQYGNNVVLDYFSGSGTTAHSIMKLNSEDGGKRKFILCQTPDPIDGEYSTIAEICKERMRRAGKKVLEEGKHKDIDVGFQVWKVRRKSND